MTTLTAAVAAAHTAHARAYEYAKSAPPTDPAWIAAERERRLARHRLAEALAAAGKPSRETDVHAVLVAYVQAVRGDVAGAGERLAGIVEVDEEWRAA